MKYITAIFCISLFFGISSCSTMDEHQTQDYDTPRAELFDMVHNSSPGMVVLNEVEVENRKQIAAEFTNPQRQINFVDKALNKGYLPLLEDISNNKFSNIREIDLTKYQSTDWESRTIGFPNSIMRLKGALLFQEAETLKYQIVAMKLSGQQDYHTLITRKEKRLEEIIDLLKEYTENRNWTD